MKTRTLISLLMMSMLVLTTACISGFVAKNQVAVLEAEKFDNDLQAVAKENFSDPERQKIFSDFIKMNTRIDVQSMDIKDKDATAELVLQTVPKNIYAEMKTTPSKDWKTKFWASQENRFYSLRLHKEGDSWQILEEKENPKK